MRAVILLPAFWVAFRENRRWEILTRSLLLFILGLSLYLYLPPRSSLNLLMDWNHPTTFKSLLNHLTGSEYRTWMGNLPEGYLHSKLGALVALTKEQFPPVLWVFMILGMVIIFVRRKIVFALLLAFLIIGATYALNYRILEIEPYYLNLYWGLAIFSAIGLAFILRQLQVISRKLRPVWTKTILAGCVLMMVGV